MQDQKAEYANSALFPMQTIALDMKKVAWKIKEMFLYIAINNTDP